MKQRAITGIVILAIFIPLIMVNELFDLFQILMMGLVLIAASEMIRLYEAEKKFPGKTKCIILGGSLLVYLSALADWAKTEKWVEIPLALESLSLLNISVAFLPMLILILLVSFFLLVLYHDFDGGTVGKVIATITYTGLGFAALTILRFNGIRYIVYLFLITVLTDVFAYLFGVKFGKHKMAPFISPKKSWEGAIAGTLIATILGTIFAFFYGSLFGHVFGPQEYRTIFHVLLPMDELSRPIQVILVIVITASVSVSGQIGDLVASKLKRTYKIKDFGRIFPGHGGVLDRLDSALFAALFLLSLFTILKQLFMVIS